MACRSSYPQQYIQEFQSDYEQYGKFDLEKQAPHLARLADYYKKRYSQTQDWTDCLKAHTLYNAVSVRQPDDDSWRQKAFKMQKLYWSTNSNFTYAKQQGLTKMLTSELEIIRQNCRSEILVAEQLVGNYEEENTDTSVDNKFYKCMRDISIGYSDLMTKFAGQIIDASIDILAQSPPCSFQAVAIGSLARGEATPYSDLEYIFLIERKRENIMEYFERLAVTSYFLIGNLGETKLSYVAIEELMKWFDDKARNGFKIDGLSLEAGNIPTGNGTEHKKNRYITTPEALATLYKRVLKNPQEEDALIGDLTAMLTYTRVFYSHGQKDLESVFRKKVQILAPNQHRRAMNLKMLKTDANKFDFAPDFKLVMRGYQANVKKDLFRFPSILMLDVTILLGQSSDNSWEALDSLIHQKSISKDMGIALKLSLAAAVYIRLSAYLYHDSHDDRISLALNMNDIKAIRSSVHQRWYLSGGLFSMLCGSMMPLKAWLSQPSLKISDLPVTSMKTENGWQRVSRLFYTGRPAQALKALKEFSGGDLVYAVMNIPPHLNFEFTVHFVLLVLEGCAEWSTIVSLYYLISDRVVEKRFSDFLKLTTAGPLSQLGRCGEALRLIHTIENVSNNLLAQRALASVFSSNDQFVEAHQCCLKALELEYNDDIVTRNAQGVSPLVQDICKHKYIKLASLSHDQRMDMLKTATPFIIGLLSRLSEIYRYQENFKLAKSCIGKAIEFTNQLYGDDTVLPEHITNFGELGLIHIQTKEYDQAEKCCVKSLNILSKFPLDESVLRKTAATLDNLGEIYLKQGLFLKAERFYIRSLARNTKVTENRVTLDYAFNFVNLGIVSLRQGINGNLYKYFEYFHHALIILEASTAKRERRGLLVQLGETYKLQGNFTKAKEVLEEAIGIFPTCDPENIIIRQLLSSIQPGPVKTT